MVWDVLQRLLPVGCFRRRVACSATPSKILHCGARVHRCAAVSLVIVLGVLSACRPAICWELGAILTSDYSSFGEVAAFQRNRPWTVVSDLQPIGSDPVGRWHGGLLYVVNRGAASNLQVLDPASRFETVQQFSLGVGRNPQDIAFAPDGGAWVSCYDEAVLLEVDVTAWRVVGSISTASFADADGIPETGWMQAVDNLLYITCQRLDRGNSYVPTGPGLLLVFDMVARTWVDVDPGTPSVDGIMLVGSDPWGQPELSKDRTHLRLGCIGWYGFADGGVEEVDLAQQRSLGFVVSEGDLGGDVQDFVTLGSGQGYAIVGDAAFRTSLRMWSTSQGVTSVHTVRSADGYAYVDLAWDGLNWLYLADRTVGSSGLRVFEASTGVEQTSAAIPAGLPPVCIVLPGESDGSPPLPVGGVAVDPPMPNPTSGECVIRLHAAKGTRVPLMFCDLRGRRVRAAGVEIGAEEAATFVFDGRDDHGRRLPSGTYRVVAGEGQDSRSRSFQIVR